MILLSDIHIGLNKDNQIFHATTIELFKEIVDVCNKTNDNEIAILGDLFHNRKVLSQKSLETAHEVADICKKQKIILVRGNHDTYYNSEAYPNWLSLFAYYDNIVPVIDDYYMTNKMCFVPWGFNIGDVPVCCEGHARCSHYSVGTPHRVCQHQ